jgi:hypoxanthine phosphoribosyltransferase
MTAGAPGTIAGNGVLLPFAGYNARFWRNVFPGGFSRVKRTAGWESNLGHQAGIEGDFRVIVTEEQLKKRVREIARQISHDYNGRTIYAVCVMEQGFVFMADLIRELDGPVVCQFIRPNFNEQGATREIFFSPEPVVSNGHVLLVEGLVDSGVTTEFLMHTLLSRGADSVKLVTLLDRQSARRVSLQPDYFGFLVDDSYMVGYGLGSPQLGRNLPCIGTVVRKAEAQ